MITINYNKPEQIYKAIFFVRVLFRIKYFGGMQFMANILLKLTYHPATL
jgi:hypothetical protein